MNKDEAKNPAEFQGRKIRHKFSKQVRTCYDVRKDHICTAKYSSAGKLVSISTVDFDELQNWEIVSE